MNIVKLQNMLRGVDDNALVNYVQNPTGEVPSYLALSELQRRKDMRSRFQTEQAPESSVAEDATKEVQPGGLAMLAKNPISPQGAPTSQGVADLPVSDNMYNEDSFAAGGIVAFEDGGEVPQSRFGRWWSGYKQRSQADLAIQDEIQRLQREHDSLTINPFKAVTPSQEAQARQRQAEIKQRINELRGQSVSPSAVATPASPATQPAPGTPPAPVAEAPKEQFVAPASATTRAPGGYGLPKLDMPEQLTIEKAIENQKKAYELAGVDPNFYKSEVDKLNAEREALKADREQAGWLALTKAGLSTMAGTSPFALVNLGKGAEAGIEQYGKDIKDIKAEDRLLKQADRKLAEAQYLQSRGDADGAQKKIAERDALIQDYRKMEYQGKVQLAAASMSANRPDINMELLNSMRQDKEYYKKDAKGNLLMDSKGQPIFDASKAADVIKGYGVKSEANTLKALSDQLKTEYDPKKRKAIQDQIDAIISGEGGVSSSAIPTGTVVTRTK